MSAASSYAKNLLEVKAILESFEGSGILVTQVKVSLQTTGLATQLLQIKDQYECLVKFTETMETAKYTVKEAVQTIQELDFEEDTESIKRNIQKRMLSNDISRTINMETQTFTGRLQFTLTFSAHNCFSRKFFHAAKTVSQ